jgi:hypothetical protein
LSGKVLVHCVIVLHAIVGPRSAATSPQISHDAQHTADLSTGSRSSTTIFIGCDPYASLMRLSASGIGIVSGVASITCNRE